MMFEEWFGDVLMMFSCCVCDVLVKWSRLLDFCFLVDECNDPVVCLVFLFFVYECNDWVEFWIFLFLLCVRVE